MASIFFDSVVSRDEWQNVNQEIREKIEGFLKSQEENHRVLTAELKDVRTQSEKKCNELDAQVQQLQEQAKIDGEEFQSITDVKVKLEDEIIASKQRQWDLETKILLLENAKRDWQREKDDLSSKLANKDCGLEKLEAEMNALKEQLAQCNKEKYGAFIKAEELNSQQLALEYKEKRLNQERELSVRQQQFLQDELDKRTKEVLNIRREMTSKLLESQTELADKTEEVSRMQKTVTELTVANDNLKNSINQLTEELKEQNERASKIAEGARQELRSQTKLCELYRISSEEAQSKVDELTKTTEELQRLLCDAAVRFEELEVRSKTEIDQLKEETQRNATHIGEMKKELDRANTLLEAAKSRVLSEECIEAMSPSVAAASRLLKSGMSLTQIFSQYVTVSEQLLCAEEENKRLNHYIDQIVQEIENRAPTIARQREDYEKSMELAANLSRQLELAAEEAISERKNAEEARRLSSQMEQSNLQYKKQVRDLSAQIRCLMRQVETLRGKRVEEQSEEVVSSSAGSAVDVIDPRLITFRDIDELQQKNQQLLLVLRQLSEKQDEVEKNAVDSRTARIQQALDIAQSEIQNLRDSLRRHEELMECVVQQRETYRKLVQGAGINSTSSPTKSGAAPSQSVQAEGSRSLDDLEKKANELLSLLEQSQQQCRSLANEKQERDSEAQRLNDQLLESRSQNARLTSQIQFLEEKEKLVQANLESYKNQIASLEQKNRTYASTVAKHEQSIAVLRDEAMNSQQQLARAEVTMTMLREEKQLLRDAEHQLLLERDALRSEKRNQNLLHVNLEAIKLNLERGESETQMRLENTIASLEQQCQELRKNLETIEDRHREALRSFEERLQLEKAEALKAVEERAAQAENSASRLQEMLNMTESRLRQTTSSAGKSPIAARLPSAIAESDHANELRTQLAESRTELENVRQQLDQVRQEAQQNSERAAKLEYELVKGNGSAASAKQDAEQKLAKLTAERDALSQNLEQVREKLKKIEERASIIGQGASNQSTEVSLKISHLESELTAVELRAKQAEESGAETRRECRQQVSAVQEKYERELVQHAAAIDELNTLRTELEKRRAQTNSLEQTIARLREELKLGKSVWDGQKLGLEKRAAELTSRCTELDEQVRLMEQQIVSLTTQVAAARSQGEEEANKSLNNSIGEEETRSSEQSLEMIRLLRRQKEIAVSRSEVAEAETLRLKAELEQVQRQLIETQANLQTERDRSSSLSTSGSDTEFLRQLETLNALTDSNRLLREERVTFLSQKEELMTKVKNLEDELLPLRESSRDFSTRIDTLTTENQTLRKQVIAWKNRTNTLQQTQEKALRTANEDLKRVQHEKEGLQKEAEQLKMDQSKIESSFNELKLVHERLVADQQKQTEENAKLKGEVQKVRDQLTKVQSEMSALEAKRKEDEASFNEKLEAKRKEEETKANEKIEPLRRIARKYKAQYEELKTEHDKLVAEHAASAAAAAAAAAEAPKEDTDAAAAAAAEAAAFKEETEKKIKELEERNAQMTTEMDQLKKDHEALVSADEKTKAVLKSARAKLGVLQREKETVSKELAEAKTKIESIEQGSEETIRDTALRSQLEGRLSRLERENAELTQAKQTLNSELEMLNQRLPLLQRQVEAYQKQMALHQQGQSSQLSPAGKSPNSADKTSDTPTANIKPMTSSSMAPQRPPSAASQTNSSTSPAHRTTPTASIRPMGMQTRTAAIQPTSVSVAPMAAATPTFIVTPSGPREEEVEPVPSTSRADENEARKRTRPTETQLPGEQEQKRARVGASLVETVEVADEEAVPTEAVEVVVDDEREQGTVRDTQGNVADVSSSQPGAEPVAVQPESVPREAIAPSVPSVSQPPAALSISEPLMRPTIRDERLLPMPVLGRNPLPFEDSGDDGIVPSTPILFRPRPNDGFAEAIVSPQVNTRFIFGSIPDLSVVPSISGGLIVHQDSVSHLESQGMDDTRIDLSQLDEGTGRSVPSTPIETSSFAELAMQSAVMEAAVVEVPGSVQSNVDMAPDVVILSDDEPAPAEVATSNTTSQVAEESSTVAVVETSEPLEEPSPPTSSTISRPVARRGRGTTRARGRGVGRTESPQPNVPRLVPISWSSESAQQTPTSSPVRALRSTPTSVRPPPGAPSPRASRPRGRPRGSRLT